ncbi:probable crossover junction endonuclease EME2 [Bufo gargarizans]|uniref:probable crossover junction endonuclease EME2 n=1 Tax=Bufo gargarizans TaxID=30331 RepID=UPI001CF46198|nr:probable crossover junction endonuclease EME2 [Bufo gargarizans]
MKAEQDAGSMCKTPRKLTKRAKTWEISDSEPEEDPAGVEKDDTKATEWPRSNQRSLQEKPEADEMSQDGGEEERDSEPSAEVLTSTLPAPLPATTTPSPNKRTKRRKNPEELEADRIRSEEQNKEKEAKRLEKERIRNLEKEEKEKRKESALALKLLRPDHCGKYMTVQLDAALLQDAGCEDLLDSLRTAGYNYSIEPHSAPYSVTWRREMPGDWTCVEGLELCRGEEDEMLILVDPKDFLTSVRCFIQAPVTSSNTETMGPAFGFGKKYPNKKITLVILGLPEYRRCQRLSHKMERHSLEGKARRDLEDSWVTWRQIDEALVFLQLYYNMEVLNLETWKQFGQHVCAVTKSVAQRPFRRHWEAQSYSFCTSAGSWRGWGPRGSLTGLPLVWRRQIQQLNRVSPAMAAAVTEAYPSPQLLMQAYAACNTEREKLSLLSDLRVPRNTGATEGEDPDDDASSTLGKEPAAGKERRIGPDISRRIWLFMTATNPELVLDLNS